MFKEIIRSTMDVEKENTIKLLSEIYKFYPDYDIRIHKVGIVLNNVITDLSIQLSVCKTYDAFIDDIHYEKKYAKEYSYVIDFLDRLAFDVNLIKELYK